MTRTTVCFLISNNSTFRRTASNLISELGYDFRHPQGVESLNIESLLSTLAGTIIVDADSHSNSVSQLTSLFVKQRVSMPIIVTSAYADATKPDRLQHLRQGAFETLKLPEEYHRFGAVLGAAMDRDIAGTFPPSAMRNKLAMLTARERETIGLFLDGHNTKVVAKALDITYQTVDKHRGRALRKIGVRTVVELQNQINKTMLHSMGLELEHETENLTPKPESKVPMPHFPAASTQQSSVLQGNS